MFSFKPKSQDLHRLDETIADLIIKIKEMGEGTEEHTAAVQSLKTLNDIRASERNDTKPFNVSPDVLVSAATSILGIVAILGFEKAGIITSKAMIFVPKPKI